MASLLRRWLAVCCLLPAVPALADVLPTARRTTWSPGIPGGIPARQTVCRTVNASTYGNGASDATAGIQAAVDACPEGQVVQLSAGDFLVNGEHPITISKGVVLRGMGPSATKLLRTNSTPSPLILIGQRWNTEAASVNLTASAPKGARSVQVTSSAGFTVGQLVLLTKLTDTSYVYWGRNSAVAPGGVGRGWFTRYDRPVGQMLEVTAISGNTISFSTPLHIAFDTAHVAQLTRYTVPYGAKYAGVEELYVRGGGDDNILLRLAAYSWVKHVESDWSSGDSVAIDASFRCVVRDSYVHDTPSPYPGGAGYLLSVAYYTADSLVENNIFINANKVMVMRASGGGNVIAYNYLDNGYIANNQGWMEVGLNASHMTCPHSELFEGNQAFNIDGDDTWGGAFSNTVFRNHATGKRRSYADTTSRRAIGLMNGHYDYSFVGNVLGFAGMSPQPSSNTWALEDFYPWGDDPTVLWRLGYAPEDWNAPAEARVVSSTHRHANFDYVTNAVQWAAGYDQTLPDSLYLTSKPAFFGNHPWPWVDPTGTTRTHVLPARARYDAGTPNVIVPTPAPSPTPTPTPAPTPTPGMVAHWKLDEGLGTSAADSSGSGNHGTVSGASWITGFIGKALSFLGLSDHVSVAHQPALSPYPATVTVWFKTASTTGARGLVNKYAAGSFNGYQLFMVNGNLCAWYIRDAGNLIYDGTECPFNVSGTNNNQWHQAAFVVDGSGGKLYVDGALRGTLPWNGVAGPVSSTQDVRLGDYPGVTGGGYFAGQLDQARIYNYALTAAQVASLHSGDVALSSPGPTPTPTPTPSPTPTPTPSPTPSPTPTPSPSPTPSPTPTPSPSPSPTALIGHWKLDEGSGGVAADASGNGHAGAVQGAAWTTGYVGAALAFDGVDDAVQVAHVPALDAYPLTVSAWFRTGSATGLRGIVNKYLAGSYDGYQLFLLDGRLCAWYIRDQVNQIYDGSDCTFAVSGLSDGRWHQAAFVVDASGGRLYVDGVLRGTQAWNGTPGAVATTEPLRLGRYPGADGGGSFLGDVDQVRLFPRALTAQQVADVHASDAAVDLIFADGFESGGFSAWSSAALDGGDLRVSAAAALASTTLGAEATVDDAASLFVQDHRPADERRYRARFYFDPSRFDPGEATGKFRAQIFVAFKEAPQRRLVVLALRRRSGQYALRGTTRLDDGTQVDGAFVPITAGPHMVELDWRRATAPGATDGVFQLWIDGVPVSTLPNLDNDSGGIDFVRLGILGLKSGASGTLLWDEFESRRQGYIGPRP